jgi:hypothetical protein
MGKKRAREADGAAKDPDKMVEDDSSDDDVSEPQLSKLRASDGLTKLRISIW